MHCVYVDRVGWMFLGWLAVVGRSRRLGTGIRVMTFYCVFFCLLLDNVYSIRPGVWIDRLGLLDFVMRDYAWTIRHARTPYYHHTKVFECEQFNILGNS